MQRDTRGKVLQKWGVNVQPLSGTPANFEVYTALAGKDGKIMGLNLPDGGHLSHGFETPIRKVSATALYFQSKPYYVNKETGLIDYDRLEAEAEKFQPKLIIAGYSAYPRGLDYERFRKICDKVGAYLLIDMAHYCGLVAAKLLNDPFEYADVVTTTTHKILRGPRGGMIFMKKELEQNINFAVFPQHQGGPHMNQIAALSYALREVASERYHEYAAQVKKNANALAEAMLAKGWDLATGGTDTHLVLWKVTPLGFAGAEVEAVLEKFLIYTHKNSILEDKRVMNPGGIRLGTQAMTTRGINEDDMLILVHYIHKAIDLILRVKKYGEKIDDFLTALNSDEFKKEIEGYQDEMRDYMRQFPVPLPAID